MTALVYQAIELHQSGLSMAEIGNRVGKSAAWVCKQFKAVGHQIDRITNKGQFTQEQAEFMVANRTASRQWIGEQIGRSPRSVSQWLQKQGLQAFRREKLKPRACECCGVQYQPTQSVQKFCSTACMGEAKRVHGTAECANCGTTFTKPNDRQKFCSVECGQEGYQKQHIAVRPYEYNGIKMRSTWEMRFAKWLDEQKLTWKYEPTFFALPNRKRYAPDFYVHEHDAYYEIKGWMKPEAAMKIQQFRTNYPEHRLVLLNRDALKMYGVNV
jgi:hypothetical protein